MKWLFLTLVVLSVLVIMPPLVHHYIYPSWGGDSAEHLMYFHNMDSGFPLINYFGELIEPPLYYGEYFTGSFLNALPMDINVSFLWFNYIAFILVIWAIGLCTAFAVNPLAGILASILASFGCLQTVGLFVGGTIFDLIGIGLLLPIVLLCLHNWGEGIGWKVFAIMSLVTFMFCHANGKYVFALMPIATIYEIVRERVSRILTGVVRDIWSNRYLMFMIGLIMALIAGFAVGIVQSLSVRLITDAMILLMIVIASILTLIPFPKKVITQYALIILVIGTSIPNVCLWFQDNNVIKEADKQAFTYLNSVQDSTVLAFVSQDIYQLFVKQRFAESTTDMDSDYIVARSIPMAFREGYSPMDLILLKQLEDVYGYKLVKKFDYDEKEYLTGEDIVVDIYGRDSDHKNLPQ